MHDLEHNALKALKKHYCRMLVINRKLDSYYPIILEANEEQWNKVGCLSEFAKWFAQNGNIYERDKVLFERFIQECCVERKDTHLFYRRKSNNTYRWAYIFVEQGENPDEEYLYVRDVNDIYIMQCDLIVDSVGGIDALTGLGNKYAFEADYIKNNIDYIEISIDNIDIMNIEQGYQATDEFIVHVADIIKQRSELAYRIHGGVFRVVTKNVGALKKALKGIATIK